MLFLKCYRLIDWGEWGAWNSCDGGTRTRTRTRPCGSSTDGSCVGYVHDEPEVGILSWGYCFDNYAKV